MAKQEKILPARKRQPRPEESLLLRSAESLGRMIGTLQRQLETATKRVGIDGDGASGDGTSGDGASAGGAGRRVQAVSRPARGSASISASDKTGKGRQGGSGATKTRSTADRKSKRASKSAAAKKSAGTSRSGSKRTARRS